MEKPNDMVTIANINMRLFINDQEIIANVHHSPSLNQYPISSRNLSTTPSNSLTYSGFEPASISKPRNR